MDVERLKELVGSGWPGCRIEYYEELTSTNAAALSRFDELGEAAHESVFIAGRQTAGRGRSGRVWYTTPGRGLTLSVALYPRETSGPGALSLLPIAGAIAVLRTLLDMGGLRCCLKWPNDVVTNERKISGTMVEARWRGKEVYGLALGIGVNLNQRLEDLPPETTGRATSLFLETGTELRLEEFTAALLVHLRPLIGKAIGDPAEMALIAAPHWIHKKGDLLEVCFDEGVTRGAFQEIDEAGTLHLLSKGRAVAVRYGDVRRLRRLQ